MDVASIVLSLGPPIAQGLYTAWRRRCGKTDSNSASLSDLIAQDFQDRLAARKVERDIVGLADYIVETLQPVFELDGIDLSEGEKDAVIHSLEKTLAAIRLSPALLIEHKLDPLAVAEDYRQTTPSAWGTLGERELALYNSCLDELMRRVIGIANHLPGFTSRFFAELLHGQNLVFENGRKTLDTILLFMKEHRKHNSYLINNFNYTFKSSVLAKFGKLYILGLDQETAGQHLDLNVSYLSVRADITRCAKRASRPVSPIPSDLRSEEILLHSKRLILKGHAGSGKSTLLQWMTIRCVEKNFDLSLRHFNEYTPILIRLREYYDTELSTGRRLLETTSKIVASMAEEAWLNDLFYKNRAMFLVDGLDEVAEEQREAVEKWLADLIAATPQSIFILTSRPSAVPRDYLARLNFDEWVLKPMTPSEVQSFIEYWHDGLRAVVEHAGSDSQNIEDREGALRQILTENREMMRLAETPLLCAVICTLNFSGQLRAISGRVDLYGRASRLLFHDRNVLKDIRDSLYESLHVAEKQRLLGEVAYWLTRNGHASCSLDQIAKRFVGVTLANHGRLDEHMAREVARVVVLRSGVLKEVTPETIEFLHKTFQEYFAALSIIRLEDEMLLAKSLDLGRWSELFLICLSLTTERNANAMLECCLERAQTGASGKVPLVLLAAAGAREVFNLETSTKQKIENELEALLPPRDGRFNYELAQAGDLALPFLRYKSELNEAEVINTLVILGIIDIPTSRKIVVDYVKRATMTRGVVKQLIESLAYSGDRAHVGVMLRLLAARNTRFFLSRRDKRFYASANVLARYVSVWPKCTALTIDGAGGVDVNAILAAVAADERQFEELCLAHWDGSLATQHMRGLIKLRELTLIGGSIDEFDFLSSLDNVRCVKVINTDVGDWSTLEYASRLNSVYVSGVDAEEFCRAGDGLFERWSVYLGAEMFNEVDQLLKMDERSCSAGADFEVWSARDIRDTRALVDSCE